MVLQEFKPHSHLSSYIDAYWDITGNAGAFSMDKVVPDGCIDIIINLGEAFHVSTVNEVLKSEKAYLAGAITHSMEGETFPGTRLVGIRFKPAAFSYFYSFASLHDVTNRFIELDSHFIPEIRDLFDDIPSAFDFHLSRRLMQPKHFLLPVVNNIINRKGNVSIQNLASEHCTTIRQLERSFKYHVGLSPKEFVNIIRYKSAHDVIISQYPQKDLLEIALEFGYYDRAHLSNEVKKYAGVIPSALVKKV
ncbi:AraC family transcriptional regulator [Chitinophaga niabensis]|uniref:AraC family transcriptional regulator n=1 Tax=Chitinophaga niabensis TaxID=536979 RepID=UPI0031BB4209